MKKTLTLAALFACALATHAQTQKGTTILGGNVSFLSTKSNTATKSDVNFSVLPSIGYFISDNFAIGTGIGYKYKKITSYDQRGLTQSFVAAPFARYYTSLSEQFKFFGQVTVPLEFGTRKAVNENGTTGIKTGKTTDIGVTIAPGFAFFPTKHIGIELSVNGIGYIHSEFKSEAGNVKSTSNSFNIDANTFAPKLGILFHF